MIPICARGKINARPEERRGAREPRSATRMVPSPPRHGARNNVPTRPTTSDEKCEVLQYSHDPLAPRPLLASHCADPRLEEAYPPSCQNTSFIRLRHHVGSPGFNYPKQVAEGDDSPAPLAN
ncbi:hypothetical protein KM043_007048 [Ampulex compressa]|nr:hypothetical protein KM043_007048 [Ampulex compressa]